MKRGASEAATGFLDARPGPANRGSAIPCHREHVLEREALCLLAERSTCLEDEDQERKHETLAR